MRLARIFEVVSQLGREHWLNCLLDKPGLGICQLGSLFFGCFSGIISKDKPGFLCYPVLVESVKHISSDVVHGGATGKLSGLFSLAIVHDGGESKKTAAR